MKEERRRRRVKDSNTWIYIIIGKKGACQVFFFFFFFHVYFSLRALTHFPGVALVFSLVLLLLCIRLVIIDCTFVFIAIPFVNNNRTPRLLCYYLPYAPKTRLPLCTADYSILSFLPSFIFSSLFFHLLLPLLHCSYYYSTINNTTYLRPFSSSCLNCLNTNTILPAATINPLLNKYLP